MPGCRHSFFERHDLPYQTQVKRGDDDGNENRRQIRCEKDTFVQPGREAKTGLLKPRHKLEDGVPVFGQVLMAVVRVDA